jgi:hypothetical protein
MHRMLRTPRWALVALLVTVLPVATAKAQYTIKDADNAPPKELDKSIGDLLTPKSIQLLDAKGEALCEVWLRKEVPSSATAQQVKAGLTYRELPETTLLAALRVLKPITDYRKQKIKPGVYTMRLAFQPMDGDHMGTAPNNEFLLVCPAAEDKDPTPMKEAKELQELSTKATGTSHPGVFLLFPAKDPGDAPKLLSMPGKHWVLTQRLNVATKGEKAMLILGLALIGTSSAA